MVRGALVGVCAALVVAVVAGCGGTGSAASPTTTGHQLRQFRVVFPEGFTRAQMGARVQAVCEAMERSAEEQRWVRVSEVADYASA